MKVWGLSGVGFAFRVCCFGVDVEDFGFKGWGFEVWRLGVEVYGLGFGKP